MAILQSLAGYAVLSFLVTIGVVAYAIYLRQQFYPVVIYLATSKLAVTVLGNMAFVLVILFGHLCKKIFFGNLREQELESISEKTWYATTETFLALTIFREELSIRFVALFTILLFVKIFHWLSQFRVEHIYTLPHVSRLTHLRVLALMNLLLIVDLCFLSYQVSILLQKGPSVLLLFAFEYLILTSTIISTFVKYGIYMIDLSQSGRWPMKGDVNFYLNIFTSLFQLVVYLIFFAIVFSYYGMPLHIIRDLYQTFFKLRDTVGKFLRYRLMIRQVQKLPDATPEELSTSDQTCIICREEMATAKRLACSHMFHVECLRSWLEERKTCPTCRATILLTDQQQQQAAAAAAQVQQQQQQPPIAAPQIQQQQQQPIAAAAPSTPAATTPAVNRVASASLSPIPQQQPPIPALAAAASTPTTVPSLASTPTTAPNVASFLSRSVSAPGTMSSLPTTMMSPLQQPQPMLRPMWGSTMMSPFMMPSPMMMMPPSPHMMASFGRTQSEPNSESANQNAMQDMEIRRISAQIMQNQVSIESVFSSMSSSQSTQESFSRLRSQLLLLTLPTITAHISYIESLVAETTPSQRVLANQFKHLQRQLEGQQATIKTLAEELEHFSNLMSPKPKSEEDVAVVEKDISHLEHDGDDEASVRRRRIQYFDNKSTSGSASPSTSAASSSLSPSHHQHQHHQQSMD